MHKQYYRTLIRDVTNILQNENPLLRPYDDSGRSGSLLFLDTQIPTVLVPDLHGRLDFVKALFSHHLIHPALVSGSIQVVFLGDAFHSERRGRDRWHKAYEGYLSGAMQNEALKAEMEECFSLMQFIIEQKCTFPNTIHFLKGNHENILNEAYDGNHPFRKFAEEGEMTKQYVLSYYGSDFLYEYANFEKSLPLCAVGARFVASHAQPRRLYKPQLLINARFYPEVIEGLTWTDNGEAETDSVAAFLQQFVPNIPDALYFAGHRCISDVYQCHADGRFVQIHNPTLQNVALVPHDRSFDFNTDFWRI